MPHSIESSYSPQPVVTPAKSSLATPALVCGIVGLTISLIPILGLFGLALGVLAVIFGFVSLKRRKGFALTGIITGALAILLAIVGIVIVSNAVNDLDKCLDAVSADLDTGGNTSDTACGS